MAKGVKTGGRDFVKGVVTNPRGGGSHNPAMKVIRRLTQEEIQELGSLILEGNLEKLMQIKDDKSASTLKVFMASVIVKAINKGDAMALNVVLDRIVGKVKEKVEVSGADGKPLETITYKAEWGGTQEPTDGNAKPDDSGE